MSDLATDLEPGRDRSRRRVSLGALAVLALLAAAVIVSGPRILKSVRTEPSASTAVASLPAQQPAAATQLPLEQSPRARRGQLATLGRFVARDPFASPLPATAATATPAVSGASAAASAATPLPGARDASASAATPAEAPAAAPVPGGATIAVNGIPETVSLKALFPAADPLFRLVALGAGEVQIGVVGGSSPGGEQTVTLVRDRALTLLDTGSGARYEIRLVSLP